MKYLIIFASTLSLFLGAAAQAQEVRRGEMSRAGQFHPRMFEQVLIALRDGDASRADIGLMNEAMPEFKVPSVPTYKTVCRAGRDGFVDCRHEETGERCPTEVELEIPGYGSRIPVKIDCNPNRPDSDGNCECEFAG